MLTNDPAANTAHDNPERHPVRAGGRVCGELCYDCAGQLQCRVRVQGYACDILIRDDEALYGATRRVIANRIPNGWRTYEAGTRGSDLLAVLDTYDFEERSIARGVGNVR